MRKIIVGLFVLGFVGVGAGLWTSHAAEEPAKQTEEKGPASAEAGGECCKAAELEKRGFDRITYGSVHAPMPPMGFAVKTSDDLWKIIAFICSINPPGANPPEKVVPARMKQ